MKAALFIILTCLISWVFALVGYLMAFPPMALAAPYMLIPMLVALLVQKAIYKEPVVKPLLISFKFNRWFVAAWLIIPLIILLTIGISLLFPDMSLATSLADMMERLGTPLTPEQLAAAKESKILQPSFLLATSTTVLIAGLTLNALFAFGEELGWRGFLLNEFRQMKLIKASLIIGAVWGIWHFPLILMGHNYMQHPVAGVFMMTLFCILLTPAFLYITIKSKSVIAASIMHGTLNAAGVLPLMYIKGGSDLTAGVTGAAGFIAIAITVGMLFLFDRKIFLGRLGDCL